MTGTSRRWLATASLFAILAGPSAALAQAERTWVDPPAEGGAQTKPAPAVQPAPPAPTPAPAAAAPTSQPVQTSQDKTDKAPAPAQTQTVSEEAAKKPAETDRVKSTADRKVRAPSRQASSPDKVRKRTEQTARRREPDTVRSRQASRPERPVRDRQFQTVQEGVESGLEVMRMRTLQFPDGRRVTILTRPGQVIDPSDFEDDF